MVTKKKSSSVRKRKGRPSRVGTLAQLKNGVYICPPGYIVRNAYTIKKTGTKVPHTCIKKVTALPIKRGEYMASVIRKKEAGQAKARAVYGSPKKCPPGQIWRVGYTREAYTKKNGVRVKSAVVRGRCVKDTGKKGKGPALIGPLMKGALGKFGYRDTKNMDERQRHAALNNAIKAYGSLPVYRKVRVLATLHKNKNPSTAKIFLADANYIAKRYKWDNVWRKTPRSPMRN